MSTKEDIRKNVQYFANTILDNSNKDTVEAVIQIAIANESGTERLYTMSNVQGDVTAVMYGLLELSKQVKDAISPDGSVEDFFKELVLLDNKAQEHIRKGE